MNFFTNKQRQAQLWIEAMLLREAKKQELLTVVLPSEVVVTEMQQEEQKTQVIFRKEDTGHNPEESQQIQDIYGKIKDLGFVPSFAGI